MAEATDVIFTGGMVRPIAEQDRPYAMPAQVFARRPALGAPVCCRCGERYYPEILRSPASQEYDHGQARRDICTPCQRRRYKELDLIAAYRAGLVQP